MTNPETAQEPRSDRSPWNWLLFIPIVVPLITALFNADSPRLFGFPVFYWLQLAFILLGPGDSLPTGQVITPPYQSPGFSPVPA